MKTSTLFWTIGGLAVGLILGGAAFAVIRTNSELQHKNQALEAELRETRAREGAFARDSREMAKQHAQVLELYGELKSRLDEAEASRVLEAKTQNTVPIVTPYRVQAYLGQKPLGQVWIVPRNLRKDTNTQQYVYEPVVSLDESLRKNFVTYVTNVVERPVQPDSYVYNYYADPWYYPTYYIPARSNNWQCSTPQPAPTPPTPTPFNPGGKKIFSQPLGTPAGAIKTTPAAPKPLPRVQLRSPSETTSRGTRL